MDYNQFVKNELIGVLDGSQAHRTFQSAVRDFPIEYINTIRSCVLNISLYNLNPILLFIESMGGTNHQEYKSVS